MEAKDKARWLRVDVDRLVQERKKNSFFLKCIRDLSTFGEAVFGSRAYNRDWLYKQLGNVIQFMNFHEIEVNLEWDEPCSIFVTDKEVEKEIRNIHDEKKRKMEEESAKLLEELSRIIDEIQ